MAGLKPRLANVDCSHYRFQPGDRIIVKSFQPLDYDAEKKLRKSIQKWAGCEVEVLIVDCTRMEVIVDQRQRVS